MITIVDIGIGNLGALANMLRRLGMQAQVSGDPLIVRTATRLILPGVGHFDHAMRSLRSRGLEEVLHDKALIEAVPVLGICLGMQIMFSQSEEGGEAGLGWIPGRVRRIRGARNSSGRALPVPHMGWNVVHAVRPSQLLSPDVDARFYFVHSYCVECACRDDVAGVTVYGDPFVSAVERGNLMGCQFHPEKSHRFGKNLLRAFTTFEAVGPVLRRDALALSGV
jgi:glutamine amidotransferase